MLLQFAEDILTRKQEQRRDAEDQITPAAATDTHEKSEEAGTTADGAETVLLPPEVFAFFCFFWFLFFHFERERGRRKGIKKKKLFVPDGSAV